MKIIELRKVDYHKESKSNYIIKQDKKKIMALMDWFPYMGVWDSNVWRIYYPNK